MKIFIYFKSLKNSIDIRIRKAALRQFKANRYVLGSIILNISLAVKLCICFSAIFYILVLGINPKEGVSDWLVLMDATLFLILVIFTLFVTVYLFKRKKARREMLKKSHEEFRNYKENFEK